LTAYRVVGIDAALVNTGVCLLASDKVGDYRVVAQETIRPKTSWAMVDRIRCLGERLDVLLGDPAWLAGQADAVVVEDPTNQHATHTKGNNPRTIAVTSLAVGAALSTAMDYHQNVMFIDVEDWMPRLPMKRGGLSYIMPKDQMARYLLGRIKVPDGASEHVLMAAGVARYWIELQRHDALVRAAG
jgi:Holliday junction resolvasome RuvABC endonuclease subunit